MISHSIQVEELVRSGLIDELDRNVLSITTEITVVREDRHPISICLGTNQEIDWRALNPFPAARVGELRGLRMIG